MTDKGPVTPGVVDKTVVDIDFSGGVNEYVRAESLDWQKYLRVADNVDFLQPGVLKPRSGLLAVANEQDTSTVGTFTVNPILRAMSTGQGVLALSANTAFGNGLGALQLNESAPSKAGRLKCALTTKGPASEFSVTAMDLGSVNGASPVPVGAFSTSRYNISVVSPDKFAFLVYYQDKLSGNVVRSVLVSTTGSAKRFSATLVSSRYLHVFAGNDTGDGCKAYQFDTETLDDTTWASPTTLTTGGSPHAVAIGAFSYVVSLGQISKVDTNSATEVSHAAFSGISALHDVDTDGTSIFAIGLNSTPRGIMKVVSTALSTTRTVTDTDSTLSAATFGLCINGAGTAWITAHYKTTESTFTRATTRFLYCTSAATIFTSVQVLPGWGQVSSPFYNQSYGAVQVVLVGLPDAGLGVGHDLTKAGGTVVLVTMDHPEPGGYFPAQYHCSATLDGYIDYVGNNAADTGALTCNPQKLFSADSGLTLIVSSIQRLATNSYGSELRVMRLNDVTVTSCAHDIISGGKTCFYDGQTVSEVGCLSVPWIVAYDSGGGGGTGPGAGLRNYVAVFEAVDAAGNRHLSRCSAPFALTMANTNAVTLAYDFPNISEHLAFSNNSGTNAYNWKCHIYRTLSGGTQYFRIQSIQVNLSNATTAIVDVRLDTTSDTTAASGDLLWRQPGTVNTALDRYPPPASSCCVRHKDRVFVARGSDVYYSSFAVFGEAPWFNPAFSFHVHGGVGDITGMASLEGLLVIFKENAVFVVDGDGPPESGGNGTEFSPPKRLLGEIGCSDARTILVTDDGVMFRSLRGIELLDRNLTVNWIGSGVFSTLAAYPYSGGASFDTNTGRAVWILADTAGTYPGQVSGHSVAVVFNIASHAWSRYKFTDSSATYGGAFQDVVFANVGSLANSISSAGRFVFADPQQLWFESGHADTPTATSYFVPVELQTGWVKGSSKQDRLRVQDFLIAAIRNDNATITASYAADYSPTWITPSSWVWTPAVTSGLTFTQLNANVPKEAVQAVSFKLVTSDPTPTSFGAGAQFDIFGLSVRLGLRSGGAKVAVAQKG